MNKLNYNDTTVTQNSEVIPFSQIIGQTPLIFGLKSPHLFSGKMKVLTAYPLEQLHVFIYEVHWQQLIVRRQVHIWMQRRMGGCLPRFFR